MNVNYYSTGFKIVSSWMNKFDLISNNNSSNSMGKNKKKVNAENQQKRTRGKTKKGSSENQQMITSENQEIIDSENQEIMDSENQEKDNTENQEMITGENQEKVNIENPETITSENQEKAAVDDQENEDAESGVGSWGSRISISSLSQDSASLAMEDDEEGDDDEDSAEEELAEDPSRSIESETTTSKASTSTESSVYHSMISAVHFPGLFNMWKKPHVKLHGLSPKIVPKSVRKSSPKLTRRKPKQKKGSKGLKYNAPTLVDANLCYLKPGWKNFALTELQAATDNFSEEKLIGQGGYAEVYKGQLEDGRFVAIKRLTRGSPDEMTTDYLSELGIIVHVDHPNIAKIIGYGVEGGMHLVLELSPHGSLASLLYGPKEKLNWEIRYKIACGTAEGICYLHEGCQRRIIHKDIKAANILLTEDFQPQIADFGLAKWLPDQWSHHIVSKVEGTFGYMPPEFFTHGVVDEKTDIYAYGVLLLELVTGRQALDSSQKSLVMWAKPLLKKSRMKELLDPSLGDAYNTEELTLLLLIASACISQIPARRPKMSNVVQVLKGDEGVLAEIVKENQMLRRLQRTCSAEFFDAEEYYPANLNEMNVLDLNRHMETVLGKDTGILNGN